MAAQDRGLPGRAAFPLLLGFSAPCVWEVKSHTLGCGRTAKESAICMLDYSKILWAIVAPPLAVKEDADVDLHACGETTRPQISSPMQGTEPSYV